MLPTRNQHLDRGKKAAISNMLKGVGRDMIACVDADYDYLLQGATEMSQQMLENPYIFHTYAYAIENFQCYAKGLHETCVMVTLNDHRIFDFERFLQSYSHTIWPLFCMASVFLYASSQDDDALRYVRVRQGGGASLSTNSESEVGDRLSEQEGEGEAVPAGAPFPEAQG